MWFEWWMWFSDLIWMWFGSLRYWTFRCLYTDITRANVLTTETCLSEKNHSSRVTAVWEWNIMIVTVDKFWLKSWGLVLFCSLAVLDPRVGWLHHGRTFSIYLCPLSFWLTVPRRVLSTSWCCPSRPCVVFLACVHLTLFLALSLSPGICFTQMTISTTVLL